MRKLFFVLAFTLVGTFAFANNSVEPEFNLKFETIEVEKNIDYKISESIILDSFDHCTITVTITYSNGDSYSATATNNQGDCNAARNAAYGRARLLASVIGGH